MKTNSGQRQNLVALNADIASYSKLLADDPVSTTTTLEKYHTLVSATVSKNNGFVVAFVGDNFMAVFEGIRDAMQVAISITSEIEKYNLKVSNQKMVRFRMGLDVGEITISDNQYYGDALNVAARVQAIAVPGGICISNRVYLALDEPALRFRSIGQQRLKNIPEMVEVYEFVDLPSRSVERTIIQPLALESPTVAVLPIHITDTDDEVSKAADVFRLELIHKLSEVPQLRVVNAEAEIGKEKRLNAVRYMLETGFHQYGEKVRVYAVLFDVTTMNVVKSYKWFAHPKDLFELSENFADDVARSIEIELIVGEPAGLYAELKDPEAIEKIYLGWYHLRSDTREGWLKAIELFDEVTHSHPSKPYGHVLSAFANWLGAANDWVTDTNATILKARKQAQFGYETGDPTGMAQAVEGAILMSLGQHEEALATIDQLEIIRPTCDVTYGLEGSIRRYLGQWEKAVDLLDVAMRLTGVNKPWYPTVKACSLFIGNKTEQAMCVAEEVLDYQPQNLEALLVLAASQVELGLDRRARATVSLIHEKFPALDVAAWLDKNPYTNTDMVERWKNDLATVE